MGRDNFVAPVASTANKRPPIPDVLGAVLGDTGQPTQVEIKVIKTDGGTQMRAAINWETVYEYRDALRDGAKLPPPVVFFDGADYWLGDGFHRVAAWKLVNQMAGAPGEYYPPTIPCEVRAGTRRDAVLCAAGANANHGLRRTNQDKRRAVETLLRDEEWAQWSNSEIARRCAVDEKTVRNIRAGLESTSENPKSTMRTGADGRTINTANIGTRPAPEVAPAKPVYTPITIAGEQAQPGTPIPPRGAVLNTPPAAQVVTLDELEVVASVTAPWHGPVVVPAADPDEEITSPLDCYDDEDANPYVGKMGKLHELKMWLVTTRDQKLREYRKLTEREVPAVLTGGLDHMIAVLETAMDALQAEANNVNQ